VDRFERRPLGPSGNSRRFSARRALASENGRGGGNAGEATRIRPIGKATGRGAAAGPQCLRTQRRAECRTSVGEETGSGHQIDAGRRAGCSVLLLCHGCSSVSPAPPPSLLFLIPSLLALLLQPVAIPGRWSSGSACCSPASATSAVSSTPRRRRLCLRRLTNGRMPVVLWSVPLLPPSAVPCASLCWVSGIRPVSICKL